MELRRTRYEISCMGGMSGHLDGANCISIFKSFDALVVSLDVHATTCNGVVFNSNSGAKWFLHDRQSRLRCNDRSPVL